ncbi:MAG TPA: hypothetical protein VH684_22090 [Xanthobacteraceae bacterium]|jgi:hypothetical protein
MNEQPRLKTSDGDEQLPPQDAAGAHEEITSKLKALQGEAKGQYDSYTRQHDQLWNLLVKSYLWWREAAADPECLDSLYRDHGIGYKKRPDGSPNFNPLIRLIWGFPEELTATDRVTISQWGAALGALHQRYEANPDRFRNNPEGKLKAHIADNGGVAGLVGGVPKSDDDDAGDGDVSGAGADKGKGTSQLDATGSGALMSRAGTTSLPTTPSPPLVPEIENASADAAAREPASGAGATAPPVAAESSVVPTDVDPEATTKPTTDGGYRALVAAWAAATDGERERFLKYIGAAPKDARRSFR